jgi:hypothetical protein
VGSGSRFAIHQQHTLPDNIVAQRKYYIKVLNVPSEPDQIICEALRSQEFAGDEEGDDLAELTTLTTNKIGINGIQIKSLTIFTISRAVPIKPSGRK